MNRVIQVLRRSRVSSFVGMSLVAATSHVSAATIEDNLGKVSFPISCSEGAQKSFNSGVALMHHMMYWQARDVFTKVTATEPDCAMAYWGIAMSAFHPLWPGVPDAKETEQGKAAAAKLRQLKGGTLREQAYIDTVMAFYNDDKSMKYRARVAAWAKAQQLMPEKFPDDDDAIAFSSLAQLALAPKKDKTFSGQRKAGEQMEALMARSPEHPGAYHYMIHAYDNPVLAKKALNAARGYGKLAPDVAHALHMPTHIFVRVGSWQETIDWNARSADSAKRHSTQGFMKQGYAHAVDYQVYGHMQKGEYDAAQKLVDDALAVPKHMDGFGVAYGLTAAQARTKLERDAWADASALPVRTPEYLSWAKFGQAEAITHFARGLGAARSGNKQIAQESIDALDTLHAKLKSKSAYWAVLADSQRNSVAAWLALANGKSDKAIELMTKAADLEDSVDKSPVTPGAVLPARELLGDMLLETNQLGKAIKAYQLALRKAPNRARSLRGAMLVTAKAGQKQQSETYREQLRVLTKQ